jgi:hypothetical protein
MMISFAVIIDALRPACCDDPIFRCYCAGHLAKGIYNVTSLETPGKRKNPLSNFRMLKMSHKALMTMWFMR